MVELEQEKENAVKADLEGIPNEILDALRSGDPQKLEAALEALPPEERQPVVERLEALADQARQADPDPAPPPGPDMEQVLRTLAPVLGGIAIAAGGNAEVQTKVRALLPQLEEKGWRLTAAVERIWAGERDAEALTAGVDANSARLIRRILELIAPDADTGET